ncbi:MULTISPECIES: BRO-N domain-containing protein [unclassified Streptomyces]|uniref:BRO-N domain-containing protein n=1 Tax=unclassified Streptomyces TaxID=2593676 RepID=UPI00093DB228|nr:Bro-N domain-containing protein [Streptomyces sp. TSRI0107]OKJ71385.1 DNA-binding protein [Streptomyces sp. TSRI0107]
MYEQNNTPSDESTASGRDAIDINDFVFVATGARLRRLTMPDGTHWFPAVDVCKHLGYMNSRKALQDHVPEEHRDFLETVTGSYSLSVPAGREWRRDMNLVNLQGLIRLVNGCTKPECEPFKAWVCDVIATIQRDGSYTLEPAPVQPAPTGGTAYVMPQQVADAIVRLEERNMRADELLLGFQKEQTGLLTDISHSLRDIADSLRHRGPARPQPAPDLTPQDLLGTWKRKNLVVTEDVHAVAAYLAPALVRGEASHRVEDIAARTGLPLERVHDCLRMLLKRGCVRQAGCAADGAPVYVLP